MKLLIIISLGFFTFASRYPGVRTSISLSPLTEIIKQILPAAIEKAEKTTLPSTTIYVHPLFIPIRLDLSDISIESLSMDINNVQITINNKSNELILTLPKVNLFLTARYDYYIPFRVEGILNLTLTNATANMPMKLSVHNNGHLELDIEKMNGDFSSLSIDVDPQGPISTIFVLITKLWPLSQIANHFFSGVFESLSVHLNPFVEKYLKSYQYTSQVGNLAISADYHFYSTQVTLTSILSSVNGSFFLNHALDKISPVVPPNYLPDFYQHAPVIVQITEYFFDSLMWALYASNTLHVYIKSEDVPSTFPYTFTTTGLNKVAPNFSAVYGNNVPVDMECMAYKVPNIDIQSQISLVAGINCNFLVRISPNLYKTAFTLIMDFNTKVQGSVISKDEQVYIIASFDRANTLFNDFSIINSQIGEFSPSKLITAFNWYVYYLVNNINNILEDEGFLVPLPRGMTFKNPVFHIYQGAVELDFEPVFA